jgi:phage terminase small subunit
LENDGIRARLDELREKMKGPKIMDAQERREKLTEIATNPKVKPDVAIKAIDVLNKMDCLYVQKTELSGTVQTVPDRLVIDYGDGGDGEED